MNYGRNFRQFLQRSSVYQVPVNSAALNAVNGPVTAHSARDLAVSLGLMEYAPSPSGGYHFYVSPVVRPLLTGELSRVAWRDTGLRGLDFLRHEWKSSRLQE